MLYHESSDGGRANDCGDGAGYGYGYGGFGFGDGCGNGYGSGYGDGRNNYNGSGVSAGRDCDSNNDTLPPQYGITALSLPWAVLNASVERRYR